MIVWKWVAVYALLLWALCGLAVASHISGNQTAINGIIGAAFGAVMFSALAVYLWKSDRR